jgi:hypothetical protein
VRSSREKVKQWQTQHSELFWSGMARLKHFSQEMKRQQGKIICKLIFSIPLSIDLTTGQKKYIEMDY